MSQPSKSVRTASTVSAVLFISKPYQIACSEAVPMI
jgi:hypothetical protein